jgi:hypothetical protein
MRILLLAAAAAVILAGGAAATLAISDSSLALSGSTTSTSPPVAPARTTEDVSGPCDEAEHAGEARCAGTTTAARPGAKAPRHDDRVGHRRHGRDRDDGSSHSGSVEDRDGSSRSGSVEDRGGTSGRGGDDNSGGNKGRGGGDDRGHGGHGRDHAEDD